MRSEVSACVNIYDDFRDEDPGKSVVYPAVRVDLASIFGFETQHELNRSQRRRVVLHWPDQLLILSDGELGRAFELEKGLAK